jgi:hypothetical protein
MAPDRESADGSLRYNAACMSDLVRMMRTLRLWNEYYPGFDGAP